MYKLVSLLASLAALVMAGNIALAQSATISSTATVLTPITATATAPLAFGSLNKGTANSISASSASAGAATFSGDEGDEITITVPASMTLSTVSGGGATMNGSINRSALRVNTTSAQAGAVTMDASNGSATTSLSPDNSGNGVGNDGLGQVYLWVGGSVTPTATQQRGNYSGSFMVSAAYSN